jgi:hypothetical protein
MKTNSIKRLTQSLLLASSVALTVCRLEAADLNLFGTNMPPVDFHGFISQGFLGTTKYNYLGSDTKDGSFLFTEAGLNVSMNPFPRTHITAQGFLYDIGEVGKYQPFLDYASIDYTFSDYIGVRAGRIRRPQGIYNDVVDLDLTRVWTLLPQGIYDARWRDFYAGLDGGAIFGSTPNTKGGSLSYEFYAGLMRPTTDGGLAHKLKSLFPAGSTINSFGSPLMTGVQLWWDTPLTGLRVGAWYAHVWGLRYGYTLDLPTPLGPKFVPKSNENFINQGQLSLDYSWKAWTFQAEYERVWLNPTATPSSIYDSWYVSGAYRFNKWLQAGTYYTEYYPNVNNRGGASDNFQKDLALSLRFDITDWWIFKIEGHYIRGTALLQDSADNPVRNGDGWFMLALKTTFSF